MNSAFVFYVLEHSNCNYFEVHICSLQYLDLFPWSVSLLPYPTSVTSDASGFLIKCWTLCMDNWSNSR